MQPVTCMAAKRAPPIGLGAAAADVLTRLLLHSPVALAGQRVAMKPARRLLQAEACIRYFDAH